MHAQIALAVPIQPDTRAASSAVSLFFSATCFLGFRTMVRPAALVSTFLIQQSPALGLSSDALSLPGSGSAEGLWLLDGKHRERSGQRLRWWEIRQLLIPFFYVCVVF